MSELAGEAGHTPGRASEPLASDHLPLRLGERVGRFVIRELLGSGGMGIVYLAYDPELHRQVAIKVLRNAAHQRIVREAQAMARLSHPNVVAVYDVGKWEGQVFIAMEHVDGSTLREWLLSGERAWAEVARVYLEAGRGLFAAHTARLVHRDFKPDNVLIDRQGRARVTDFGLVRALTTEDEGVAVGHSIADSASTVSVTGTLFGTPGYIAPEVLAGHSADARADQYSFSVSLDEACRGRQVSARLRRAIERGLSPDPSERYPSLEGILDLLARESKPPLARRARLGLAALAMAALASCAMVLVRARAHPPVCAEDPGLAASVWSDTEREAVRGSLLATGMSYADRTSSRTVAGIDRYVGAWAAARKQTCEATWVHGTQSGELLDRRMQCLDRAMGGVGSLVRVLARADGTVTEMAQSAVENLPSLDACSAQRVLLAAHAGDATRTDLQAFAARLSEARALQLVGKFAEGAELLGPVLPEIRRAGSPLLEAESLLLFGHLQFEAGKPREAEPTLDAAIRVAEAAALDEIKARILAIQVDLVGFELGRYQEGERLGGIATAVLERIGGDDAVEANLWTSLGKVAFQQGKYEDARALHAKALATRERKFGPEHMDVAVSLQAMAIALGSLGRAGEEIPLYERALAIRENVFGPEHPAVAETLNTLAIHREDRGDYEQAVTLYQRALTIRLRAHGPEHTRVAYILNNLGSVYRLLHRYRDAEASLNRARAIFEKVFGRDDPKMSELLIEIARIMTEEGRYDESQRTLENAFSIHQKSGAVDHPTEARLQMTLGELLFAQSRYERAATAYQRALAIGEKRFPDSFLFADIATDLAEARIRLGRTLQVVELLERAVRNYEATHADPRKLSRARELLGRARR
ncbi:serine/threonine-protein kinase [Pendulispora rubella]|uniref:Serine/threonine-protein kinase n=1 Tax=Pendulispora rubella TaxID=2741070 RepID=A0ABZ2LI72_9BACT